MCYPWGAEYLHAHRTLRLLAIKLSAAGFHTLQFDFFGTGNSGGESTDADLSGWEADLRTAIEELIEISGVAKVNLIGLRLGGTVAARVALQLRSSIEALVLWDPVVSGPKYLKQLGVPPTAKPPLKSQGFPLTERMLQDLLTLDLSTLAYPQRTLALLTERSPAYEIFTPLTEAGGPALFSVEFLEDVRPWLEHPAASGLVPLSVVRRILSWLE